MAQITILATDDDFDDVWEMILTELRMTAYPDPWFGDLPAPALRSPADVSANLAQFPRVAPGLGYFLTSQDWSVESLDYHLCENNPNFAPHWYVSPRHGGPSIHFVPSFDYPWHKESHQVISGMFTDYSYYFSAADYRAMIERPPGLVATMKAIRQRLRSLGTTMRAPSGERAVALTKPWPRTTPGSSCGLATSFTLWRIVDWEPSVALDRPDTTAFRGFTLLAAGPASEHSR